MTKAQVQKAAKALRSRMEEVREDIDSLKSEAEDYYNDRSESWQEGDAGSDYQNIIDLLQEAYDNADSAFSNLDDAAA